MLLSVLINCGRVTKIEQKNCYYSITALSSLYAVVLLARVTSPIYLRFSLLCSLWIVSCALQKKRNEFGSQLENSSNNMSKKIWIFVLSQSKYGWIAFKCNGFFTIAAIESHHFFSGVFSRSSLFARLFFALHLSLSLLMMCFSISSVLMWPTLSTLCIFRRAT